MSILYLKLDARELSIFAISIVLILIAFPPIAFVLSITSVKSFVLPYTISMLLILKIYE